MLRIASLVAVALIATSSMAFAKKAKTYSIQDSDFCDHATLTVAANTIVGATDAPSGCDDGLMAGVVATVKPLGGSVLTAGSDFGVSPELGEANYNLKTLVVEYYFTVNGSSVFPVSDGISFTDAVRNNHKPRAALSVTR